MHGQVHHLVETFQNEDERCASNILCFSVHTRDTNMRDWKVHTVITPGQVLVHYGWLPQGILCRLGLIQSHVMAACNANNAISRYVCHHIILLMLESHTSLFAMFNLVSYLGRAAFK